MEKFKIDYSKKNVPIPSKFEYKLQLISKVEKVIKRMRWKALEFLGRLEQNDKKTYGFPSRKCPPPITELSPFEEDMLHMIQNLEFEPVKNEFLDNLKEDIEKINKSKKLLVSADKSRHLYLLEREDYKKLLTENITKEYKRSTPDKVTANNVESKVISDKLGLSNRIEKVKESEAYITIKDHKEYFPNTISCRLINPSKSDLGKVSKVILDRINDEIRTKLKVNQWKNTYSVIDWFKNITNKPNASFITFDIVSFYPSISYELFNTVLNFAKGITTITNDELDIINQSRKALLFFEKDPWVRKIGREDFDVPMGCFDGAEICELVGSYILYQLRSVMDITDIGLYRDDGLAVLHKTSARTIDNKRKQIIKIFKSCGLNITIQINLKVVEFLDVEFNLTNETYKPYRKPNNEPVYLNKNSNHPVNILKQLPDNINLRISNLSSNEEIYNEGISIYEEALKKSGFDVKLSFIPPSNNARESSKEKNRKRKIIWFNPPFSSNVKTKVGKIFINLVNKHFYKGNKFHKIFNRNTLKVSFSCMQNIEMIISAHNKSILQPTNEQFDCNCRNKSMCPVDNKCLTPNVIYEAQVRNHVNDDCKRYIGASQTEFKTRYSNHKKDFTHAKYEKSTELSKYVWSLKKESKSPIITWRILKHVRGNPQSNYCKLCLNEKFYIINSLEDVNLLNSKSEFISGCRHQNNMLLKSVRKKNGVG